MEVTGSQKQIGADPENAGTVAKGSYSYTAPDGAKISVNWVADENGFQPTGKYLLLLKFRLALANRLEIQFQLNGVSQLMLTKTMSSG